MIEESFKNIQPWWEHSIQFSHSVVSDSLWPHGPQHTRPPCPSPTSRACSNSYPSSQWCHPTISSSVIPFSACLQSFPASGSFPMSQLFVSGGQSIGVSASESVLPMNIQDWFPLGLTDESITPNKTNTFKICSQNRFRLCIISVVNKLHRGVPALPWLWSTALNTILSCDLVKIQGRLSED